jgi:hypothetical protein
MKIYVCLQWIGLYKNPRHSELSKSGMKSVCKMQQRQVEIDQVPLFQNRFI